MFTEATDNTDELAPALETVLLFTMWLSSFLPDNKIRVSMGLKGALIEGNIAGFKETKTRIRSDI